MKVKLDDSMGVFLENLSKSATKANAGTALVSFKKAKKFGGGDIFIIFAAKGADKFDVISTLVRSIEDDDDDE